MKKLLNGRALYTEENRIWVAQGMTYFAIDYNGKRITDKFTIGTWKESLIGKNRLTRQLFRQGIHHLVPLPNGDVFLTSKKKSYIMNCNGEQKYSFTGYLGNKPAHQGICVTPNGYIFFGEYSLNNKRNHDSCLYRSIDGGKSFQAILKLKNDAARHIHYVKWDPYENCIWLGTGDKNYECLLLKSNDYGITWQKIGSGSQNWRAIGICFDRDYLIWGTDAGSVPDQNHIIRMNRKTYQYEIIDKAEGPCHGCASFKDGRVFISTGIEGGKNEKDRYARLKTIKNDKVEDVLKQEKDYWPLIVQFGVIRFPLGTENSNRVVFTMYGLKDNGESVYVE